MNAGTGFSHDNNFHCEATFSEGANPLVAFDGKTMMLDLKPVPAFPRELSTYGKYLTK